MEVCLDLLQTSPVSKLARQFFSGKCRSKILPPNSILHKGYVQKAHNELYNFQKIRIPDFSGSGIRKNPVTRSRQFQAGPGGPIKFQIRHIGAEQFHFQFTLVYSINSNMCRSFLFDQRKGKLFSKRMMSIVWVFILFYFFLSKIREIEGQVS